MKKEFFNKKNILVLLITLLIVVVMILLIIFNPFGNKKKDNNETKEYNDVLKKNVNTKDDLIKALEAAASKYYEENYYLTITEPETELEKHSEFGIKLSLNTLNSVQPFSDNLMNSLKKYKCNLETSRVIIIPNKPFEKTDYKTKTSLYCDELN